MPLKIHSLYDPPPEVISNTVGESLTEQHHKADCDINTIVDRMSEPGYVGDILNPGTVPPMYGDFTSEPSFHEAMNVIAHATQAFDALPAKVRIRFSNSPSEMLRFLDDENNREEAVRLGLVINPPTADKQPVSVSGQSNPATSAGESTSE